MSSPDVAPCCRAAAHQSRCSLSSTEARERPLGLARGRRWRSGFPVFILFSLTRLSCGRRPALPTNIYYRRSVEKRDPWRRVHDARRHSTQDICKTRYITNACVHCVSIVATVDFRVFGWLAWVVRRRCAPSMKLEGLKRERRADGARPRAPKRRPQ